LAQNLVLIGQGIFSRRTLGNRPFPLKASIAYTTLPCGNALACDEQRMLIELNGETKTKALLGVLKSGRDFY
jgi:hypothetical protein